MAVFSLLLYLAAVAGGVYDVAVSGMLDHDHHGQPCPVHHFLKQTDSATIASAPAIPFAGCWTRADVFARIAPLARAVRTAFDARGPPTHALS